MKSLRSFSFAALLALSVSPGATLYSQTFSVAHSFAANSPEPAGPIYSGLMAQGRDGNVYAASSAGGKGNRGAIYRLTPSGALNVLYSFDGAHGSQPSGGLTLGADGSFYGATAGGGTYGYGTVFRISSSGSLTVLHHFARSEGGDAYAPPILAADGNYYGTTSYYGAYYGGSIYRLTPGGTFTVIHQFGSDTDTKEGVVSVSPLALGPDRRLYGTTTGGGTRGGGVVFRITTSGTYSVLHNFDSSTGDISYNGLTFGADGFMYGTVRYGGSHSSGAAFKISTSGSYSVLRYLGSSASDGSAPFSNLVPASDGSFYGSAYGGGGSSSYGTLFKITGTGAYSTIHAFVATDGSHPESALLQTTAGTIYGQTYQGGSANQGSIYKLTGSLPQFAASVLPMGVVGSTVQILGQGFVAGTTAVSFAGKPAASVTVVSPTYLTAVVPAGAATGTLTVKTGTTSLNTLAKFRITPTISSFTPGSGAEGTKVVINGSGLSKTSSVTFGNVKSTEVVIKSDSQITAVVPSEAVTGKIVVSTPGGTATSTAVFTVVP